MSPAFKAKADKNWAYLTTWNRICELAATALKGIPVEHWAHRITQETTHGDPRVYALKKAIDEADLRITVWLRFQSYAYGIISAERIFQKIYADLQPSTVPLPCQNHPEALASP